MLPATMRILGIDPGSRKTGWGVLDVDGKSMRHIDNGVLFLDDDRELSVRLRDLAHRLRDTITQFRPDCVALEDVFVHKNPRSALLLGQARGVALAAAGLADLPVYSYAPTVVKQRVAGTGRADKDQLATMICTLLGLAEQPYEDAADAVAIAMCCALELAAPKQLQAATAKAKRRKSPRASLLALAKAQGKA
jgi:crossover junction endodeoxyribonuclease RuvC